MARWKLLQPHYLNTLENEWEQRVTSRASGRQITEKHDVPRLFDPNDPGDCDRNGDCIVSHQDKGQRGDHVFFGPPTPDMEPVDAEAEAITAEVSKNWVHPIEGMTGNYSQVLLETFERQLTEAITRAASGPKEQVTIKSPVAVPNDRVATLERQVEELKALLGAVTPDAEEDIPPPAAKSASGASRRA